MSTSVLRVLQSSIRPSTLLPTAASKAHRIPSASLHSSAVATSLLPTSLFYSSAHRTLLPNISHSSARSLHTTLRNMGVHHINSVEEFKSTLATHDVVILDAFAEWCGPCKMISPVVSKWSDEYKSVHFAKIDVDDQPELSMALGIRAMPTFLVFKDGKKVDELVGANPTALKRLIEQYAA